jgi:predicted secreted protein
MASNATAGAGTTISWNGTTVNEVTSIGDLDTSADDIEVTDYQSTDGYKEYIQGLKDGGEVEVEGNFYPSDTGQSNLISDYNAGTSREAIITLPGSIGTWTFDAYVKGFATQTPIDGKVGFTATLKVTGKPVFA